MQRRLALPDLPLAIGAAFLLAGSVLMILSIILYAVVPGKRMKLCEPLNGMAQVPAKVRFSTGDFLNGRYQAAYARQVGAQLPYYPAAVRLRNQLEFSLFGVSPIPGLVYGAGGELLEAVYIHDYCTRNLSAFMQTAPASAAKLRQIQNQVESRGQIFLYVITPSKVAQYPEDLPATLPCLSARADRNGLVPAWSALLRQQGIHMLDTTSIVFAAHGKYPFQLFPKGGTHWNQVGSALAAQAVAAGLNAQFRDGSFAPFSFTWQMSSHPAGLDMDMAALMNLLWRPQVPPVPEVSFYPAPAQAGCHKQRVMIVGGSFMWSIGAALSRLPCVSQVTEYFYWEIDRMTWRAGALSVGAMDPAIRDADLRNADVILFEENEGLAGHSNHGAAFYDWLSTDRTKLVTR